MIFYYFMIWLNVYILIYLIKNVLLKNEIVNNVNFINDIK